MDIQRIPASRVSPPRPLDAAAPGETTSLDSTGSETDSLNSAGSAAGTNRQPDSASSFTPSAASGSATSREALESRAFAAEKSALATAARLSKTSSPGELRALDRALRTQFQDWQKQILPLVRQGAVDSAAVRSFAAKVEQANVIAQNVPPGLSGAEYAKAAETAAGQIYLGDVSANPLLLVPPPAPEHTLDSVRARGLPTTEVEVKIPGGETRKGQVRSDVVMLFCPGVITDETQFLSQSKAALESGLYAVRAPTGTFIDPEENARTIAKAIGDARSAVKNPNAKVLLVGYSQGATNVFAFMRDAKNERVELTRDVAGIHIMHGAARGSQVIDTVLALNKSLQSGEPLTPEEQKLIDAFQKAAKAELSAESFAASLDRTKKSFELLKIELDTLGDVAAAALGGGLNPADRASLAARLFKLALEGKDWTQALPTEAAAKLGPLWRGILDAPELTLLRNPSFQSLLELRKKGLESLSSAYGEALMRDPKTAKRTEGIPILNTVGEVPPEREQELISPLNAFNYQLFQELGLPSDSQVSVDQQRLGDVLPNAIDIQPEAVGHWGAAGLLVPGDHDESYFKHFSPTGLTRSVMSTFQSMGVL
ncbi:MAG: hypothetical protein ACT4TC_20605 [Myxococcaceae bacterium]